MSLQPILQPVALAIQTRDGKIYTVRRATPDDAGLLVELLSRLSDRTLWLRYMAARPFSAELARREAARMLAGSARDHFTLIVFEPSAGAEVAVAVAELVVDADGATAEVALLVRDDAQGRGIGSLLLRRLVQTAQATGVAYLRADVLAENAATLRMLRSLGLPYTVTRHPGAMQVIARVPRGEELLGRAVPRRALVSQ